ncbi:hypothetical protein SAMN05428979_0974 [Stappia sp. ES.058]|nr:hypothetical protein SAMN05428979_0974 [Stappia sp. ES.058]
MSNSKDPIKSYIYLVVLLIPTFAAAVLHGEANVGSEPLVSLLILKFVQRKPGNDTPFRLG